MPPAIGDIDRIAGFERCSLRIFPCFCKTRKDLQVRIYWVNEAGRRSRRGEFERPQIQVRNLLGGKQYETAAARYIAGNIFAQVIMRCRPDAVTKPDAAINIGQEIKPVRLRKERRYDTQDFRLDGHCVRHVFGIFINQVAQEFGQLALPLDEVKSG